MITSILNIPKFRHSFSVLQRFCFCTTLQGILNPYKVLPISY